MNHKIFFFLLSLITLMTIFVSEKSLQIFLFCSYLFIAMYAIIIKTITGAVKTIIKITLVGLFILNFLDYCFPLLINNVIHKLFTSMSYVSPLIAAGYFVWLFFNGPIKYNDN